MKRYGSVAEALQGVAERYTTLRSIVGRDGTLQNFLRVLFDAVLLDRT